MGTFRKNAVLAAPAFALLLILGSDTGKSYLRKLATHCINNIYANEQEILKIPDVPDVSGTYIPSYIALCQNWLNEDVQSVSPQGSGKDGRKLDDSAQITKVNRVVEYDGTCKDWSSPHGSVMDIVSALVVTKFCQSSKYRNNCDRVRVYDESSIGFDHSTIQEALSTPTLGYDNSLGDEDFVKNQCRRALIYFDPQVESARIGSKAHHHCFAWPDVLTKNTDVNRIPNLPTVSYMSPLSLVIQPLIQRYYHAAVQWRDVTDKPPQEENSGVIVYFDQLTLGINYTTYRNYIPSSASSITILSGPLCAKAFLKTGQLCNDYGQGLADYLAQQFPKLTTSGFKNGPGVIFQIAASTAGISSRLALAQLTICAPHTTSCYLPALSRATGSSIVLEDPNWGMAIDFFTVTGHQGKVNVVVLDNALIPPLKLAQPPDDPTLDDCSKKFREVNILVGTEGYPTDVTVPPLPTDAQLSQTSDQEICLSINSRIGEFLSNQNVKSVVIERVPSAQMVADALAKHQAIGLNVNLGDGWGSNGRHGELGLDADVGLSSPIYGSHYIASLTGYRVDSIARIKQDYDEESNHQRRTGGNDPNNIFEIKCPETPGSDYIVQESFGGDGDKGGVGGGHRRRRMVAVDARTFKFGKGLTKACAAVA
jgi:hypothetical protein